MRTALAMLGAALSIVALAIFALGFAAGCCARDFLEWLQRKAKALRPVKPKPVAQPPASPESWARYYLFLVRLGASERTLATVRQVALKDGTLLPDPQFLRGSQPSGAGRES